MGTGIRVSRLGEEGVGVDSGYTLVLRVCFVVLWMSTIPCVAIFCAVLWIPIHICCYKP